MFVVKVLKKVWQLIDFKKIKNINWGIVFFINFLISILIFTKFINKINKFKDHTEIILNKLENYSHIPTKYLHFTQVDYANILLHIKTYFIVTIIAVLTSNILHLILASFFPKTYVNISSYAFIFLFLSISSFNIFLIYKVDQNITNDKVKQFLIIISFIFGLIGLFLFFFIEKYGPTSILLIKESSTLVKKYPSLFLIAFIESIMLFIMNILFTIIITLSFTPIWPIRHIVSLILYLSFSYYWIASTLYYICYMTISGVVKYEYQKEKSNWSSFKSFWKVISCQFNTAVFAGLALTIIQFNKHRAAVKKPKLHYLVKNRNKFIKTLVWILEIPGFILSYVLTFIYSVIESIMRDISSNALIYCMIYDCSYKEGTERWLKENVSERIDKINQNVMIKNILYCHRIIFTVLAILLSALDLFVYDKNSEIIDFIATIVMTFILMHSTFSILCTLIKTTSETLFLCFVEIPQKMNDDFKDLYLQINKLE